MCTNQPPTSLWRTLSIAIFVALTLFGFVANQGLAQAPVLQFERFSIEDGLSSDTVYSIWQDSQGFLWFGTWNGLNRYDGYEFTVFKHSPLDPTSLSHSVVDIIYEDRQGTLWLGTGNGLNRFEPATGSFRRYHHDPENPKSLNDDEVFAILEDQTGQLWVATRRGLNRFDPITDTFVRYYIERDDLDSEANSILLNGLIMTPAGPSEEATDALFWIVTAGGIYQLNPEATDEENMFTRYDLSEASFGKDEIVTLFVDSAGTIWINTFDYRLIRFEPDTTIFTSYFYDQTELINVIFKDSQDVLWLGTNHGLARFDQNTETFLWYTHEPNNPYSLSDEIVYAIFEDWNGNLWIGTEIGANKLNRTAAYFTHYQPSLYMEANLDEQVPEAGIVTGVVASKDGMLWFATAFGGLAKYDPQLSGYTFYRHEIDNPNSLSDDTLYTILGDADGTLWLGTDLGLDHFDPTTSQVTRHNHRNHNPALALPEGPIWSIYQAEPNLLWLGTQEHGLIKYAPNQGVLARYPAGDDDPYHLTQSPITAIIEDQRGSLWLATLTGLLRFDPQDERFTRYDPDPSRAGSLNDAKIFSIYEDRTGTLWIGTNSGLHQWDSDTDTFTVYTQEDGLQRDAILGILADQTGQLWLSSDWGLSRFDPNSLTFRNYNVEDGLITNRFVLAGANQGQGADNRLFFTHIKGVTAFDPSDFESKPAPLQVVLTDFRIEGHSVVLDQPLSQVSQLALSYDDDMISFEFALLDYASPEQNHYLYKLEGFDEAWTIAESRQRLVTYTDLAGGQYTFRVRGRNSDGLWQEKEVAVDLVVADPPWQTWWAYGLYGLLGIALVAAYVRYRTQAQANALAQAKVLNKQLQRIDDLFANAPLCIFEIDLTQSPSAILTANHRAELVYGWSASSLMQLTLEELSAADAKSKLDELRRQVQLGKTVNMQMTHVRRDGSPFPVHINVTPGLNDPLTSNVVARHSVVIVEDITLARERLSEMAAIEAERQRIAADIHDGLAQDLAALRFRVRQWQRLIKQNPQQLSTELDEAREILSMSLQDVRRSIFALRPIALDEHGFWPTVRQFVSDFSTQHQLKLRLDLPDRDFLLPTTLELPLFRVIQEALNNVSKHAQASQVSITCQKTEKHYIKLIICDNGVGFDPATVNKSNHYDHLGLKQMREKVEALQGTLLIESQLDHGTCLTAQIPLEMDL